MARNVLQGTLKHTGSWVAVPGTQRARYSAVRLGMDAIEGTAAPLNPT